MKVRFAFRDNEGVQMSQGLSVKIIVRTTPSLMQNVRSSERPSVNVNFSN